MKQPMLRAAVFSAILMMLATSCRHKRDITCDDLNFTLAVTHTDALLSHATGTIHATATGGEGFTFSLDNHHFQDSGSFSGLSPYETYTVYGKNSLGCIDSATVTIGSINPCEGVTIQLSLKKTDAAAGSQNGSITATASGSTGFTYSLNGGPFQASGTFTNLAAGSYNVIAKNADGCLQTGSISVGTINPCAGVTVTVNSTQVNPTGTSSNCSITATATGGSGFTYSLNNGTYQTSGTFSNLAAGNYTVTAKNSNGCTGVKTVSLGATNPCAGVTVTVSSTQVNPTGTSSNGSITASATGGSGFTYQLNNGAFQASGTFSNIAAGTYTVTAKNSNGCLGVKTVTLTATDPCAGVTVTVTTTQVNPTGTSSNGSITASATGGTGFTYKLNNGAFQTSGTFSNLAAGAYTVTAKNSNGCLGVKSVTLTAGSVCSGITITINTVVANTVPCTTPANNGSITVTASGSTGFTYN